MACDPVHDSVCIMFELESRSGDRQCYIIIHIYLEKESKDSLESISWKRAIDVVKLRPWEEFVVFHRAQVELRILLHNISHRFRSSAKVPLG